MAAQAVDFTLSGQVSTAFAHVSNDATDPSTSSSGFGQFGEASNRFRMNGSSELDTGATVGIQFELAADPPSLRHANIQYGGGFGKVTLGQGSEAGDGSAGSGVGTGVYGIRAGAYKTPADEMNYFGSLNAGGRADMIRYDTPAIGPITAAVSAANVGGADHLGTMIALKQDIGGTEFAGKVSTHNIGSGGRSIIGAAVGVKLPAGLIITGAWAKAKDLPYGAKPATTMNSTLTIEGFHGAWYVKNPAADWNAGQEGVQNLDAVLPTLDIGARAAVVDDPNTDDDETAAAVAEVDSLATLRTRLASTDERMMLTMEELTTLEETLGMNECGDNNGAISTCEVIRTYERDDTVVEYEMPVAAVPAKMSDPSYFQGEIGYNFGDTTVAATWYQSQDFMGDGTDGTALGIGATHVLGKTGAKVFAAARKYDADNAAGDSVVDQTVFLVGTVVTF